MRRVKTIPDFNGVAAGQTAFASVPAVDKYHKIQVTYDTDTANGPDQTNMEAELTEIRLKINGVVQRTFSATELFAINAVYGIAFSAGILPIYFSEPWMRTANGEDVLGWGMGDVSNFTVEIDIDSGADAPTLAAVAETEISNEVMGPIVKWRRNQIQVSGTGIRSVTDLPRNAGESYKALHAFEDTAADITDVLVRFDGEDFFDLTNAQATALYADAGFVMQDGVFSISPQLLTGRAADIWPLVKQVGQSTRRVQDFRVDFNMANAENFTLVSETVGLRD
jgi:hypothetical protein